jgi:hypothetical protein
MAKETAGVPSTTTSDPTRVRMSESCSSTCRPCLMNNHFHLVMVAPPSDAETLKNILGQYFRRFRLATFD